MPGHHFRQHGICILHVGPLTDAVSKCLTNEQFGPRCGGLSIIIHATGHRRWVAAPPMGQTCLLHSVCAGETLTTLEGSRYL